jgi:hypothetical protein
LGPHVGVSEDAERQRINMDIIDASLRPGKLGGQNEINGTAAPFTNANGELLEVTVMARSITNWRRIA